MNTFSLAKLVADRRFSRNIKSEQLSVTGVSGLHSRVMLERPQKLRFTTVLNVEAGIGTFQYARASVEGTATRPVGRFVTALTGAIGSSIGNKPCQSGWFLGGVRTVRGQIAGTRDADAFWLARAEVGTKQGFSRPVGFFDIWWAGSREAFGRVQPQREAGVGVGLLDGSIRVGLLARVVSVEAVADGFLSERSVVGGMGLKERVASCLLQGPFHRSIGRQRSPTP